MMNTDETKEHNPPLSILQRLDRLELLVLFLEKKQCYTTGHSAVVAVEKCLKQEEQCKSLSHAFEEVHHKGTLMERVAQLENRVIQLSIDLDLGNTSRSSSSISAVAEKLEQGSGSLVTTHQESIVVEACSLISPTCRAHRKQIKAMSNMSYNRKWFKWLKLGC